MKAFYSLALAGARASFRLYAVELTPTMVLGSKIPRSILQALFFVLVAQAAGGNELARFALIGNAVHLATFNAVVDMSGVIESEKWAGTLPYLIASPANWLPLIVGRSAASYVEALFRTILVLCVLLPLIAPDITVLNLLRAAPLLLITVASVSGMGWLLGALSLPTRWGLMLSNTVGYLLMVLSGVNFPLFAVPPVLQWIGRFVPETHGLLAVRAVVAGASYSSVIGWVLTEITIGIIYAGAAWLLFNHRLRVARETGDFEQV